jgi:hypothetical protein
LKRFDASLTHETVNPVEFGLHLREPSRPQSVNVALDRDSLRERELPNVQIGPQSAKRVHLHVVHHGRVRLICRQLAPLVPLREDRHRVTVGDFGPAAALQRFCAH